MRHINTFSAIRITSLSPPPPPTNADKRPYPPWELIGELSRAKRASGAPWVSKSTHPRKSRDRTPPAACPSVRTTGIPMFTFTLSSYFGSPWSLVENWLHINVVINWQLSKQGIRWPVSPDLNAGSVVDPSRSSIFKLSADKLQSFQMITGSSLFF